MIMLNSLVTCLFFSTDLVPKAIATSLLMLLGSIIVLTAWVILLRRLIILADGSRSIRRYVLWGFLVPGVNLVWIPWAIISGNHLVRKTEDNFINVNAVNHSSGVQILSVPLLLMYLFWTVLGLIVWSFLPKQIEQSVLAMYTGTILISILIVFGVYLVYLAMFVHKFWINLKS
jgi:hypothetical protein